MTPIYTAESTLDAELVQDMLAGAGITAFVLGPGVVGEGAGAIRVVVEEGEADLARVMVREWETGPGDGDEDFDLVDSLPLRQGD